MKLNQYKWFLILAFEHHNRQAGSQKRFLCLSLTIPNLFYSEEYQSQVKVGRSFKFRETKEIRGCLDNGIVT